MAKPPIIISNGGIVEFLAQDIEDPKAESKIMANLTQLNENAISEDGVWSVAKWLVSRNQQVPMIFLHRTDDNIEYQLEQLRDRFKDDEIELGQEIYNTE